MTRPRLLVGLVTLVALVAVVPGPAAAQRVEPGGAPPPGSGPVETRGFVRVIDGDTVEALVRGKRVGIGLAGIDAPPINTDCGR